MTLKLRGLARIVFGILFVGAIISLGGCNEQSEKRFAETLPQIESAVGKLLSRYQIDEKSIRTRKVASGDGKFSRIERRIVVEPEFNSLNFNHDLSEAVAQFGATAIATEKSDDKSVTMHVKKDGVILMSLIFKQKE